MDAIVHARPLPVTRARWHPVSSKRNMHSDVRPRLWDARPQPEHQPTSDCTSAAFLHSSPPAASFGMQQRRAQC